jgi:hypothetical protein
MDYSLAGSRKTNPLPLMCKLEASDPKRMTPIEAAAERAEQAGEVKIPYLKARRRSRVD